MSAFVFDNRCSAVHAYSAEVPLGIKTKTDLLDVLSTALRFPNYFGGNWDALEECIRDLSWLPEGDVILSHEDLPLREEQASLSTYLSILEKAVEEWRLNGERDLIVTFPSETEILVRSAIK